MKRRLTSIAFAAAMLLTLPGCGAGPGSPASKEETTPDSYSIVKAAYPHQIPLPNPDNYTDDEKYFEDWQLWREDWRARREKSVGAEALSGFLTASVPEFLTGTQGNEVYSPINVYIALAMLAELTDGNSRTQILDLLGSESIEALRTQAGAVWNTAYRDDGAVTSIPASSLWLNEDVEFVQETMDALAENYYASSYRGEMGSKELNKALQTWLNEQTGGLLKEQAAKQELSAETVMALATTIYFRAKWSDEFNPGRTEDGEFIILSPDGGTIPCEYMKSSGTDTYYWSDHFSAVAKRLENGGQMWFIKPDNDSSVSELLDDPTTMEFLLANGEWEDQKHLIVNLSVPKFDVAKSTDLRNGLLRLGLSDIFDPELSDFTPTTTQMEGIYLSKADHAARVTIDEEGVEAAAYTVLAEAGAGMPPKEEIDFILDRPFLFAITTESGLPLFVGVVQKPA